MSVHIPYTNQCRIINFPQRQRIVVNGFCRVTKYRRCRVCGKPDWCGYTTDEQTSICMRVSNGSKGTSRNGGNIFHHNRLFLVASPRIVRKQAPPSIEIAPIEIRNAVYEELIRRTPAVKYYSQLIGDLADYCQEDSVTQMHTTTGRFHARRRNARALLAH
jgi:hypothetical protein